MGKRSSCFLGALSFLVIGCSQTLTSTAALNFKIITLEQDRDIFLEKATNYQDIAEIPGIPKEIRDAYSHFKSKISEFNDFEEENQDWGEKFIFKKVFKSKYGTFELIAYENHYLLIKDGEKLLELERNFITQEQFKNLVIDKQGDWRLLYQENYYYSDEELDQLAEQGHNGQPWREKNILFHNGKAIPYEEVFGLYELWGKVFYFFKKENHHHFSYKYDGKEFTTDFEMIVHDTCGCDLQDLLTIQANEDTGKLIFRGSIDGVAQVALLELNTKASN